jgi:acyl-CoA synthetase (AMP-forming)/AMP-acid ligase II
MAVSDVGSRTGVLAGLMQDDYQLTLRHVLERMRGLSGDKQVITLRDGGKTATRYAEVGDRIDRLCRALGSLGIGAGDRVATFMWNSQEHLEVYVGVPCMGAVLHTLNIRLFPEQLTYIANHAEDQVIFVDDSLVPVLEKVAPTFETVRHYVVVGDGDSGSLPNVIRYEDLIADQQPGYDYPDLDERTAAGLCYTSGTTGNPKGVLYSHRSNILHSLGTCLADAVGIMWSDRVMPVVPMFHANAWGLPYACGLVGADLVMPSRFLQAEPIAGLIESERVSIAGAVPTIWLDLLRYADEHKPDLSSLRTVMCGGAAVPESLMRAFEERHGVRIIQAWGMTETSPVGAVARPPANAEGEDHWRYRCSTGRIVPLFEARLVGDQGEVAWDGEATGEVEVRGPWIASDYFNDPAGAEKFHDGWLRTGDVASIDAQGFMRITDRAKDLIKSGGEWISSVELENELMAHPDVAEAAVIAKPDERWTERPLACVVLSEGCSCTPDELREHLAARVAKWWIPEEFVFIEAVPKTSVGKFDKKVLRRQLAEGELI